MFYPIEEYVAVMLYLPLKWICKPLEFFDCFGQGGEAVYKDVGICESFLGSEAIGHSDYRDARCLAGLDAEVFEAHIPHPPLETLGINGKQEVSLS